jgi:1-acyl-sn-glycerol-3-phosphate acyltransferase
MLNYIGRFFRMLFGVYAMLIFIGTLILTFLCYIIIFTCVNEKRSAFIAHQYVSRPWAKTLFFFFGIRFIVKNKNLLDKNRTYIFIANHRSQLDIPAYAIATNHTIRFLAKAELTKIPLMGYIIKRLYVSVDRKDKIARAKSMDNMVNSLRENISVFICPEGTRNKTPDPLLPFHDGAFRLAIQSQTPLAILVIKNAEKLLSPLRPIELSPGIITGTWCNPIETEGMTQEDLPRLKDSVINAMLEVLR